MAHTPTSERAIYVRRAGGGCISCFSVYILRRVVQQGADLLLLFRQTYNRHFLALMSNTCERAVLLSMFHVFAACACADHHEKGTQQAHDLQRRHTKAIYDATR